MLDTDASFDGIGAVLTQSDEQGNAASLSIRDPNIVREFR